jgi:DNA-binding SARP family transcriptional activator
VVRRAAALLAAAGDLDEAVNLYRQISDHGAVASIAVTHAPTLLQQGHVETLLKWLQGLPDETLQRTPWALYWLGKCKVPTDPVSSKKCFEQALRLFDAERNAVGAYLSWSAAVQCILYGFDEFHPLDGRDVSERDIVDALWPDADGDVGHDSCAVAVHRLRRLLSYNDAITLTQGKFSLNSRYVWVDVWAFERVLAKAQGLSDGEGARAFEKAMTLYKGPFLNRDVDAEWAQPLRERLRSTLLRHLQQRSHSLFEAREFEPAIDVVEKELAVDPLAEESYRTLIQCYQALGRRAEAIGAYRRCQRMLASMLQAEPSHETVALYQALRASPSPN